MIVLMISKALIVGAYHKKVEELANLGVDLHVVLPHRWGPRHPEVTNATGYEITILRCHASGKNHVHWYGGLHDLITRVKPDVLHIDEESYSLVTFQAMKIAERYSIPALFFNWQNIQKKYPFPFSLFESYNIRHAGAAIAGNQEAKDVLLRKGCAVPIHVIPQFGVDPVVFSRRDGSEMKQQLFGSKDVWVVGYGGRLVEAKGLMILLDAVAGLPGRACALLIGDGPLRRRIEGEAKNLDLSRRLRILGHVGSSDMPRYLNCLDCLVLPSVTRSNWKEQFGRILIEAMACNVAVVGSNSGEIPNVIGDAGVIVPEGDVASLRDALHDLYEDEKKRNRLAKQGRRRVEKYFTQRIIARKTLEVYRSLL